MPDVLVDLVQPVALEDFSESCDQNGGFFGVSHVAFDTVDDSGALQAAKDVLQAIRADHRLDIPCFGSVLRVPVPRRLAVRALKRVALVDQAVGIPGSAAAVGTGDGDERRLVADERPHPVAVHRQIVAGL